jgi:phosphate transport system substrate-binding protein
MIVGKALEAGRSRWRRLQEGKRAGFAVIYVFLLLLSLCYGSGCRLRSSDVVMVSGSTTLLPLVQEAANRFMELHEGKTVLVQGGGSSVGIAQLKEGIIDIANASRELKPEEDDGRLVDHPIALDVIAIVVHPNVKIRDLSQEQVKGIFTGSITNWKEVGGEDAPIVVVVRDRASGTREIFDNTALEKEDSLTSAIECNSNGIVRETVSATPNSIGYLSIGYVNSTVKMISYNGVVPGKETAKDRRYPLSRFLHMYTHGEPQGAARDFIEYVLSDEFQREEVAKEYIPVVDL